MPQFETVHEGHKIKVVSAIVGGGKCRWAVLIDGILLRPPVLEPSDSWDIACDQGIAFAKGLVHAGK